MKIKIPAWTVHGPKAFLDWADAPVLTFRTARFHRFEILRRDLIIAFGLAAFSCYYFTTGGWWMVMGGLISYAMMLGLCLMVRSARENH